MKIKTSGLNTEETIKRIYLMELKGVTNIDEKNALNKKALMYGLNSKDLKI